MQEASSMAVDRARISRLRDKSRGAQTMSARSGHSFFAICIHDLRFRIPGEKEREGRKKRAVPLDKVPLESPCNACRDVQPGLYSPRAQNISR